MCCNGYFFKKSSSFSSFLILAFFNSGALFVILGAEFLAMMLVIVYVGAVAVLFLFVVMMLNINYSKISDGFQKYFPIGLLIGFILFVEIILMVFSGDLLVNENDNLTSYIPNTHQIGTLSVSYTHLTLPTNREV